MEGVDEGEEETMAFSAGGMSMDHPLALCALRGAQLDGRWAVQRRALRALDMAPGRNRMVG